MRMVGVSQCFRREVGSHGQSDLGIWRVHQFTKIEQIIIAKPEDSWALHEELLQNCVDLWNSLGIHYEVVNICTGDMGTVAAKKYDLEAWIPVPSSTRKSCPVRTAPTIRPTAFASATANQAIPTNPLSTPSIQPLWRPHGRWWPSWNSSNSKTGAWRPFRCASAFHGRPGRSREPCNWGERADASVRPPALRCKSISHELRLNKPLNGQ